MELLRKVARWIAAQPWLGRIQPAVLNLDKVLYRLTKGRVTVVGIAGMPSLILTVTGRKTGLPRQAALLYVPDGDDILLVGSNWGGPGHPMWTVNLMANPEAVVNIKGRTHEVKARLLSEEERTAIWPHLTETWPAYDAYRSKTDRELRVFRLTAR
ncbi:deazaflavin-dependent oxidoreductase (nitroreductase family) [Kibdelosporangium banguiense]|uniref:Deazaflavin-dependent oxidoreductase (Nitroreductase family) n=1 Tax=Kibdelosporangium banguiense TaxID=1365924 RepID=A0ABS4U073_9PSEU|nr:nitroreductase family deazaflavin-dependent oxidoreductase [Kibdelosporangium banguiense]MBP2330058.1 deazaflavin-dependent oxidoreductase (nitroreductase family) [Kibdelosporangium banguiense]